MKTYRILIQIVYDLVFAVCALVGAAVLAALVSMHRDMEKGKKAHGVWDSRPKGYSPEWHAKR